MRPYPQQYERDWHGDRPDTLCVLCRDRYADPVEIGGHYGVREVCVCWPCERERPEALVQLVDDLDSMDRRSPRKRAGDPECPTCLSPACDCDRVTVLGDYWVPDHERRRGA